MPADLFLIVSFLQISFPLLFFKNLKQENISMKSYGIGIYQVFKITKTEKQPFTLFSKHNS